MVQSGKYPHTMPAYHAGGSSVLSCRDNFKAGSGCSSSGSQYPVSKYPLSNEENALVADSGGDGGLSNL